MGIKQFQSTQFYSQGKNLTPSHALLQMVRTHCLAVWSVLNIPRDKEEATSVSPFLICRPPAHQNRCELVTGASNPTYSMYLPLMEPQPFVNHRLKVTLAQSALCPSDSMLPAAFPELWGLSSSSAINSGLKSLSARLYRPRDRLTANTGTHKFVRAIPEDLELKLAYPVNFFCNIWVTALSFIFYSLLIKLKPKPQFILLARM